jgi:hypothetical protein
MEKPSTVKLKKDFRYSSIISIKVKTIENKQYEFRLSPTTLILQLKQEIQKSIGLEVSRQKIIFRGRLLQDNQTLLENDIHEGHTLNLVAKLTPQEINSNIQIHPQGRFRSILRGKKFLFKKEMD